MEYLLKAVNTNKVHITRLTEIEKSDNELVNVINESEREMFVDINDIITYCFSNATDHERIGHIIKDIMVTNGDASTNFKVLYYDFCYDKYKGEYTYEIGEDTYYLQGYDYKTNHIKEILLNRVKEFKENEQERNELNAQNRMAEADRLRNIKKEALIQIKRALNRRETEKSNITSIDFKNYVDANEDFIKNYIRENWKYRNIFEIITSLGIVSSYFSTLMYMMEADGEKCFISLGILASFIPIIIGVDGLVSKKVISDASKSLMEEEQEGIIKTL